MPSETLNLSTQPQKYCRVTGRVAVADKLLPKYPPKTSRGTSETHGQADGALPVPRYLRRPWEILSTSVMDAVPFAVLLHMSLLQYFPQGLQPGARLSRGFKQHDRYCGRGVSQTGHGAYGPTHMS